MAGAHTPGPWNWPRGWRNWSEERRVHDEINIYAPNPAGMTVLAIAEIRVSAGANWESNADVLSAAPDLLKACRAALVEDDAYGGELLKESRHLLESAIAKAEGRES